MTSHTTTDIKMANTTMTSETFTINFRHPFNVQITAKMIPLRIQGEEKLCPSCNECLESDGKYECNFQHCSLCEVMYCDNCCRNDKNCGDFRCRSCAEDDPGFEACSMCPAYQYDETFARIDGKTVCEECEEEARSKRVLWCHDCGDKDEAFVYGFVFPKNGCSCGGFHTGCNESDFVVCEIGQQCRNGVGGNRHIDIDIGNELSINHRQTCIARGSGSTILFETDYPCRTKIGKCMWRAVIDDDNTMQC